MWVIVGVFIGITFLQFLISSEHEGARHAAQVEQTFRQVRTVYPVLGSTWPDGTFLHIHGKLEGSEATDPEFGFSVPGVFLRREAWKYVKQYVKKYVNKRHTVRTIYSWEPDPGYSAGFAAGDANLEHVPLDPAVLSYLGEGETVHVPHDKVRWPEWLPAAGAVKLHDGYYFGVNSLVPTVGDRPDGQPYRASFSRDGTHATYLATTRRRWQ